MRTPTLPRPVRPPGQLAVYVDADCGLCSYVATWLGRLDVLGRLHLVPLQEAPAEPGLPPRHRLLETLHVRDREGRWWTGAAACLRIARRVPALWPLALLGRVPQVERLLERGYARVARDRRRISQRLGLAECRMPRTPRRRDEHATKRQQ
jgi:predicted DCC family thiol-disulfide oxidoreductase YuxK